jgi:RIO kinase 2
MHATFVNLKLTFITFSRRVQSLDNEVSASGFSKEIQEFDKLLTEMNREADEDEQNEGARSDEEQNKSSNDVNNNNDEKSSELNREAEEKYARSILESEEISSTSSPKKENEGSSAAKSVDNNKAEAVQEAGDQVPDGEEYDKFDDSILNKQYRPYRDQKQDDDEESGSEEDEDNYSMTSCTSTIMDPKMVRSKVKQSLLRKMKTEKRRIRNKGESAIVTDRIRAVNDTIKSSLGFF